MNEFAIEWTKDRDYAGVTAPAGSALKNRLLRYAEERPDEVKIIALNKDGSIFAHVPINWVNCRPPRQVSEKQRENMRQRSLQMWEEKRQNKIGE